MEFYFVILLQCSFTDVAVIEPGEVRKATAVVIHTGEEFQTIEQLQSIQPVAISESPKIGSAPLSASSATKSIGWFIGSGTASEGDNKSSSSGGSTSSKSGSTIAKGAAGGGEFPWHLSVQAALQIAKIPAPPLERLLPVGFNAPPLSPTVKSAPRIAGNGGHGGGGSPYESPESPMSRMDMITIGKTQNLPFSILGHCETRIF